MSVSDGCGAVITIFTRASSSGADLKPFFVPLGVLRGAGAWTITTGATSPSAPSTSLPEDRTSVVKEWPIRPARSWMRVTLSAEVPSAVANAARSKGLSQT